MLLQFGDKIPADKKEPIQNALNKLKEAHKNQDIDAVDRAMTEMNSAWTAASEEIYKAQQGSAQQPGPDGNANGSNKSGAEGETVTDAEFEEVK